MVKIYHNGRRVDGRFDSLKSKIKRGFKFLVKWSLISSIAYIVFMVGAFSYSTESTTYVATAVSNEAPVLQRIADCESGNGTKGSAAHYKNGQVILKANTNGSVDIGKYQVNLTYWGKKATELGLDLTKEEDNKEMAEWIYANNGTGDWSASAKCWKK